MNSTKNLDARVHEHERANRRGWVDNQQDCPEGELRGSAMLVKITEDVRKYAAEEGIAEQTAIEEGLKQKASEYRRAGAGGMDSQQASPEGSDAGKQPNQFLKQGAELYATA